MSYLTLSEAAAYVNHRSTHNIEPAVLLRAGVHGALQIAALFSSFMRNTSQHRNEDVLGLLIIPPRHLLEIELEGEARISGAVSLDGCTMYSPQVKRTFQQLVVLVSELDRFIPMLLSPLNHDQAYQVTDASPGTPAPGRMLWTEQAQSAALTYIARHRAQNLYPSQRDVADAVEAVLRVGGVLGDSGKPVSAEYIARNALRGEWWAKNKP